MADEAPLAYLFSLEQFGIKFGLENMRALVEALDHPERAYPIAHVAGTNGKGSVSAMLESCLRAAGHRTGRYTSPHLIDLAERFAIDGQPIARGALEAAARRFRRTVDALCASGRLQAPPTFFEATTAVALDLFRESAVDVAVCEVGLGGRLDATNVVEPRVTAITSIGFDHQQYLGSTLEAIAAEKGGIIKSGVPVVLGALPAGARQVIESIARERGAPVVDASAGTDRRVDAHPDTLTGLELRTAARDYGALTLGLAGSHQVGNALVAVRMLELLDDQGIQVPAQAVRTGLRDTVWPGRLDRRRLPGGRDLLMDAAHNPEGAQALAAFLASEPGERRVLVFGAMKDKDAGDMLSILAREVGTVILTRADTARSADPAHLERLLRTRLSDGAVIVEPSLPLALAHAWRLGPRVVVAGSIFLLGEVMTLEGRSW